MLKDGKPMTMLDVWVHPEMSEGIIMPASELYQILYKVYPHRTTEAFKLYEAINRYGLKVAEVRHNLDARLDEMRLRYPLNSSVQIKTWSAHSLEAIVVSYVYDITADRILVRVGWKDNDQLCEYECYLLHMGDNGVAELKFATLYVHPEHGMVEITE